MPQATTTTYLQIESIGADKLISTMAGLQKSMNFVATMLKNLNKGLGIVPETAKKGAEALDEQAKKANEAAAATNQLRIAMAAQMTSTAQLAENVKKLTQAHEESAKKRGIDWVSVKSKIDLARESYELIKNSLVTLGQEALKMSRMWDIQRQAEERLNAAMRAQGIGENIAAMKEWASAMQNVTTYGDEQILTLASQAARFSKNEAMTKRATAAAMDFAMATGGDASTALNAMGRAMQGNSRSLQQLGIFLDEIEQKRFKEANAAEKQEFILKKLETQYKNAASEMAKTPTGALKQAQNILGDIEEQVGRLVAPSLYAGLGVVKDYLLGQKNEILEITNETKSLKESQDRILVGLATAGGVLIDLKTGVIILKNAVEFLADSVLMTIGYPLKMLAPLFDGMAQLPGLSENIQRSLRAVAGGLRATYEQNAAGLLDDVDDIKKAIEEAEKQKNKLWNDLEKGARAMKNVRYYQGTGGQGPGANDLSKTKKEQEAEALSFEIQLDRETSAFLSAESKKIAILQDFTEKRMALEQSQLIDYQTKLEQKKELDRQEQEALRQVKLRYAQETGDQLTIIEDQYRQERMAKEAEATKALEAEQMATMQKLADNLKQVSGLGVDMLTGWIEGTGDWRSQLYDALKSFSKNLMTTAIASIIDQALVNQAKAQGSQAQIPIVGPILALAAGAAMFATTMALKSKLKPAEIKYASGGYISAGMVRGGAWGRDSVPALLEPGERVLSKKETEAYDSAQSRAVVQNITINVSGQLSTPAQITDTVRRVLVPELKAAARAGYAI